MADRDTGSLVDFFTKLFDTSDFPARWHCGNWTSLEGWIHILADTATFAAYFAIPAVIAVFAMRRRDLPFPRVAWLFVAFIFACGATHLIEATLFWHPWYRLSGLFKVVTASVSGVTVGALITTLPRALDLPGRAALSDRLEGEVKQREQARRELANRNDDLDRFASAAAHDLQAPLRGMYLLAGFIEEDEAESLSEAGREHLRQLRERSLQMQRMVRGLLEYSRSGSGGVELERVCTRDLVQETWKQVAAPAGFRLEIDGHLPDLEAPRAPLQRVLQNLIANAVAHHDRDQGSIRVGANREGDAYRFTVEDDDPGIPPGSREHIFEMFARLSDGAVGDGMGLALAARDVRIQGGKIWVEPAEPRGARFCFLWPIGSGSSEQTTILG
ncbi:sensor histidine kinase [Engelhardtia mirabilis]|uniref:histidine kinase n=1 Tax=Engelhardtia mirabilis TaxID=2528011 RepID=A0A518BI54_9BACT|nr:Phytochrome-like protein cph1 [Planctomycetes bacterium Pla133]QDV00971.1 Phytochrome-like protein cph1 [Planctomycetes bacterium Pla86]